MLPDAFIQSLRCLTTIPIVTKPTNGGIDYTSSLTILEGFQSAIDRLVRNSRAIAIILIAFFVIIVVVFLFE